MTNFSNIFKLVCSDQYIMLRYKIRERKPGDKVILEYFNLQVIFFFFIYAFKLSTTRGRPS